MNARLRQVVAQKDELVASLEELVRAQAEQLRLQAEQLSGQAELIETQRVLIQRLGDEIAELKRRGVLANAVGPTRVRMVTHYDVTRSMCEEAIGAVREITSVPNAV